MQATLSLLPAVLDAPESNPVEARAKSLWLLQSVLICGWADGKWMVDLLRALVLPLPGHLVIQR